MFSYLREYRHETILCVNNLSPRPQSVALDLAEFAGRTARELSGGEAFSPITSDPWVVTLPPHGFFWFELEEEHL